MKLKKHLKTLFIPFLIVSAMLFASACEGDYRAMSVGMIDEVYVVMDSTQWSSETALAIEETFGKGISTLPSYEHTYRLLFRDFNSNSELEQIRKLKNISIIATVEEEHKVVNVIRAIMIEDVEVRVGSGEIFAFHPHNR